MDDLLAMLRRRPGDFPGLAGNDQPERRPLGIEAVRIGHGARPVRTTELDATPFATLVAFEVDDGTVRPDILIVPPLSGHFGILLRDMVVALAEHFRVLLVDWSNVRHVPARHGPFGFDDNVATVVRMARRARPGFAMIGVCQGGVPALAATALLAAMDEPVLPSALALIAAPIDPLARPTRVVRLLREHTRGWFVRTASAVVPEGFAGSGRIVYPAQLQRDALLAYLRRHLGQGELRDKVWHDDGTDPARFPFLELFSAIMDLDAKHFVENIDVVFHGRSICQGSLTCHDVPVDLRAIRTTALLTIEGTEDDIAAPGQTSAAHALCAALPADLHRKHVVDGAGHFSLLHGEVFRREVLPVLSKFCDTGRGSSSRRVEPARQGTRAGRERKTAE